MSQIIVFDRSGKRIGYLSASVQRWWTLNEYGQATFDIPMNSPKCNKKYLGFGNLILVRREGLPDWGGVIDAPREWDYMRGVVTVNAYSGEYLLSFRLPEGSAHAQTLKGTPGSNFKEIINIANRAEDLNIRIGTVEDDSQARETKLVGTNPNGLYDDACALAEDAGFDWDISPRLDVSGQLFFSANFRHRRGIDRTYVLRDGKDGAIGGDVVLSEQGRIYNDLTVFGDGSSSSKTAHYSPPVDVASRAEYGLRQGAETLDAKDSESTLKETAIVRLRYWRQPRAVLGLTVLDVGEAFQNLDLGDRLPVVLQRAGFRGGVGFGWGGVARVTMLDYSDDENTVELACEEVEQ